MKTMAQLALLILCSTPLLAQTNSQDMHIVPRRIVTAFPSKNNPVGEMVVRYDGKVIPNNRVPFDAPDDWLKHITVTMQNNSARTITTGMLQLAFTDFVTKPMVVHYVQVGMMPEHQMYTPSGVEVSRPVGETPISIAPGDYITFSLAKDYEAIRSKLEARGTLLQLTSVTIDYGGLWFDGDYHWNVGNFRRADQTSPGKYIPTEPENIMGTLQNTSH